jgi:hypothetical protein
MEVYIEQHFPLELRIITKINARESERAVKFWPKYGAECESKTIQNGTNFVWPIQFQLRDCGNGLWWFCCTSSQKFLDTVRKWTYSANSQKSEYACTAFVLRRQLKLWKELFNKIMGKNSSIEWTDHTFNPWWGCSKVSPGCVNCYAETWARRLGATWVLNKLRSKST